jgi:hypothetical protein
MAKLTFGQEAIQNIINQGRTEVGIVNTIKDASDSECNSEVASDQLSSFKLFAAVNKSFTACSVSGLSSVARAYTLMTFFGLKMSN